MAAADVTRDRYDSWMHTAEALKLRHALSDDGGAGADG